MADRPPDLVLSGVNRGQNVAEDVTYSGTIAGAMEGAMLGIPAIALSQAYGGAQGRATIEWDATEAHAAPLIRKILSAGIAPGGLVNVNFPACPPDEVAGVAFTRQGQRNAELMRVEERRDGRGFPYYWLMFLRGEIRFEDGTDLAALARRKISVTPLRLDLTDDDSAPAVREGFRAALKRGQSREGTAIERVRSGRARPVHSRHAGERSRRPRASARARARAPRALHAPAICRHLRCATSPCRSVAGRPRRRPRRWPP